MKKLFIYVLNLLFAISYSLATDIKPGNQKIEKFVNEQGFYQNTVKAITSDENGYLWISTPNGLVRYDGYSFEYFYHNPEQPESIPNNFINNLLKGFDGKLWIGTRQGLCIYIPDKEQFIPLKYKIRNETFIKEDPQKRVWVGKRNRLHIYEPTGNFADPVNKIALINLAEELEQANISDIEFLSASEIIVATTTKIYLVTLLDSVNYSFKVTQLSSENQLGEITKIIKSENSLWIGTNNGVFQTFLENNNLTVIRSFFSSNSENTNKSIGILSMFLDKEKDLWLGTTQNGVLRYNSLTNDFVSYTYDSKNEIGLTSNRINCFYEDDFGVMWIGTAHGGLNKLDKNQKLFQNYSHNPYDPKSLSGNLITNISEDKQGRVWFSFYQNTICRSINPLSISEGNRIEFERLEQQLGELNESSVVRIFQDSKGFWWIGTQTALYFYDDTRGKLWPVSITCGGEKVETGRFRVIVQPDENHILIGGLQILLLENPWESILKNKPVSVEKEILKLEPDNSVTDFEHDSFGNYWFGTRDGIFRLVEENGSLVVKNQLTTSIGEDGLQLNNSFIFCIHKNQNKDIWVGTFGGGLMKIQLNPAGEPEQIKSFHKKDGLPDEAVYGILEDEKGKFWISTDMGICRFDPISEEFDVFDVNDGILNNNFRQAAFLKTKSGIILMGGLNGLTAFDPEQITENKILPKVLISRLKINEQAIIAGEKLNNSVILEHSISDTKKLVLGHQNRNISLDIIVQHNSTPKKNRISYMLEGVNQDWIEVDKGKTTATYTNLGAGTYTFFYKGTNGDGIGTEQTSELEIKVLAPWYFRWWSLSVWGIIILLLVYGIFRYLVRLEKLKQKLKFEQLDKERIHEIDQAKLRFFTNISHDIKTPLSLIVGPLEKIAEQNIRNENQRYFSIIQNNIKRLQRLVDQIISYRKAENGYLELEYTKTTLGNFLYPLLEAFEENIKQTTIHFFYKVNAPNRQVIIDIDKTERVVLNLISNAIKYSKEHGNIRIEAGFTHEEDSEKLYIEVTDTGIGIPPEKIDKIFDRFYRGVEDRGTWSGTGIGLALCKSLIDLMKGNISVESAPGEKTTFKIVLPFDNTLNVEVRQERDGQRTFVTDWIPSELSELQVNYADNALLPSLLIIDDEQDVRSFLQESLRDKYNVTLAVDGEDGLKKLAECQPQLVISDVMMPNLNGYQFCEKIKSNPATCHIPVILLTALDDDARMIEGLELGADDYIIKPFSIKNLEIRVKKLIENKMRIIEYFSNSSKIPNDELNMSEREQKFIKIVIESVEKNLSDSSFGVEELAKEVGMSTSHFYRRLKQLTGQVPNVYLRNFRLQRAAELLEANKDLNANEVMYQIGIESPSYFSTSFKKLHGVSPSEFAKRS